MLRFVKIARRWIDIDNHDGPTRRRLVGRPVFSEQLRQFGFPVRWLTVLIAAAAIAAAIAAAFTVLTQCQQATIERHE